MRDVARLARVSVATVSAVVNEKPGVRPVLVTRVKDAMKALDYHPDHVARSLKVRKTTTIGVVIPDFASGFFVEVVRGVEDVARTAGYSVLLCNSNDDVSQEQRHLSVLFSRRVDGILLASTDPYSITLRHDRQNVPIVLFDRIAPGHQGPAVVVDNHAAAYEAVKYLISLGHRRIAFIAGRLDLSTGRDRAEGFRKAMEDAHLPVRADYLMHGDFKPGSGYEAGLQLLRLTDRPTAIFSSNSHMTVGLLKAMQELGTRCPEDVSIFGFDDLVPGTEGFSFGALLKPELTVIAQPGYQIGRRAAEMLLKMLTESSIGTAHLEQGVVILKAELCIRNSVAPPSADLR
jgi:LacI family transcriptional regulator, galactose operon repressor